MISIVIPIYNEEKILDQLYARLISTSPLWKEEFEIVFVDDGSADRSYEMLKSFADTDSRIRIVKLSRNFGHQAAISAGLKATKGAAVIIMDGDLQDPPEELPRFLEKWREGYQVVYAIRTKRKENILKRAAYFTFYRFLKMLSDINMPLDSGDFCVMDRKVVDTLNTQLPEKIRFVRGLRAYSGFKQTGVQYERSIRAGGDTKYTFRKLLRLALDGIFDFSTFPLRIATYMGFLIAVPAFLLGIFFIFHRILDFKLFGYSPKDTPGMATLAVAIFFLGGVLLIILGILGEYIGRIYIEVKKRPQHIVEEIYDSHSK